MKKKELIKEIKKVQGDIRSQTVKRDKLQHKILTVLTLKNLEEILVDEQFEYQCLLEDIKSLEEGWR